MRNMLVFEEFEASSIADQKRSEQNDSGIESYEMLTPEAPIAQGEKNEQLTIVERKPPRANQLVLGFTAAQSVVHNSYKVRCRVCAH